MGGGRGRGRGLCFWGGLGYEALDVRRLMCGVRLGNFGWGGSEAGCSGYIGMRLSRKIIWESESLSSRGIRQGDSSTVECFDSLTLCCWVRSDPTDQRLSVSSLCWPLYYLDHHDVGKTDGQEGLLV